MTLPPSAFGDGYAHLRLWLVAVLGLGFDLWTKWWAFTALDADHPSVAWEGLLEFRRSLNAGAVFGLGVGMVWIFIVASFAALGFVLYLFHNSAPRQRVLHVALGMILAGALGNLYDRVFIIADVAEVRSGVGPHLVIGKMLEVRADDSVVIGAWPDGTYPQSYSPDRIISGPRRQGVVRDFVKFLPTVPAWVPWLAGRDAWPWIFNVADALLVCGVGTLLLNFWFVRHPTLSTSEPRASARAKASPRLEPAAQQVIEYATETADEADPPDPP